MRALCVFFAAALALPYFAEDRDYTCFQSYSPYMPEIDTGADVAIVYGSHEFAQRAGLWREKGYTVSYMTGIAWGGYGSYYGEGDAFKKDEVQTAKSGKLYMHGNSKTVGYNVPSQPYVEYIKKYIEPALEAGAQAVYLEEPEYWANTGWSEAFKKEWGKFYGEPWQQPDSSVDAQYRASKLKYELYFNALSDVFAHVKAYPSKTPIECHVPTHSLINYAQWRIVSPESHLSDIPDFDGYIAQVWTGTARSPNFYRNVRKERTFETGLLEFSQMLGMVRPTGKKVWFLADPVEDNPNHTWSDYKVNYECTVIASLFWPEVHRFEIMPWPGRVFKGRHPKEGGAPGEVEGIPPVYATELLTVFNALNDMDQSQVSYDTGARGIGVIVSDTLMFQRAAPNPSDGDLGSFYGLALPLVKHGVPVEVVQLENTIYPECLKPYKVLLLTYEGQKPLKPDYHAAINKWVRDGGGLIFVEDGTDPYHNVREWWNDQGTKPAKAYDDLFARLGVTQIARGNPEPVGNGFVRIVEASPAAWTHREDGSQALTAAVSEMVARQGRAEGVQFKPQNYMVVRRGPYVIAAVVDESISDEPLRLKGPFVDLFDASLPVVREKVLSPGQRALLYDVQWAKKQCNCPKVLAAAGRVKGETFKNGALTFTVRGPVNVRGVARILAPTAPKAVTANPPQPFEQAWDAAAGLLLGWEHTAGDIEFRAEF